MSTDIWDDVDPGAQEQASLSFPYVIWMNGKPQFRQLADITYTGGMFLSYEEIGKEVEIKDWKASSFVGDNQKDINGVAAHQVNISIVRTRRRWFRELDGRKSFRPWKSEYIEGYRGQMQAIGFIRGLEDPVCFVFKGYVQKSMTEVMAEHSRKLVSMVNRRAPKGKPGLPPYAVWMSVKAGSHCKVGQGSNQSDVTLPQIVLPEKLSEEIAIQRVISRDQLRAFQALYKEAEHWAHEWDAVSTPMSLREQGDSAQAPRARSASANVPDDPFGDEPLDSGGPFENENDIPF
jgi:hypothetical protein